MHGSTKHTVGKRKEETMTQNSLSVEVQEGARRQRADRAVSGKLLGQAFEDEMYSKHLTDNLRSDWPSVPYQCRISDASMTAHNGPMSSCCMNPHKQLLKRG